MMETSKAQPQTVARFPQKLARFFKNLAPAAHPEVWIVLIGLGVNLLLVTAKLMPSFAEINPFDEAKYVESGWLLLKGEIRDLAWGPLVALYYAPTHLFVGHSPDWFMLEAWVGRFLLFISLWLSLVYLAHQLRAYASPFIVVGILFVTLPLFLIIENQSDAVFVSLSVLSIANLVIYTRNHRLRQIAYASVFVGLGVMARVETIVLIGSLVVLALALGRGRQPGWKLLAAAALPALGLLACLSVVNLLNVGNLNLGVSNKSYESFEMNQSILTGGDVTLARQEAERLFGTQAENHGSVLRAILRNPGAFWQRIAANAGDIPWSYFYFFGKTQGFILLLFSAWGVITLLRRRAYAILAILLFWPLHAVIPLGFLAKHVIPQTYYLPMLFGAIGIAAAFSQETHPTERAFLWVSTILVALYSLIDHKPAFLHGAILVVAIFTIAWLLRSIPRAAENRTVIPIFLLLFAGLILRGPYPFLQYATLGKSDEELAVHYMEQNLPDRTIVLAPFPLPAIAARMVDVPFSSVPQEVHSPQELWNWLVQKNAGAAYVDERYSVNPQVAGWLEAGRGQYFELGYHSQDNKVRVYQVKAK